MIRFVTIMVVSLVLLFALAAKDNNMGKPSNLQGRVHMIDKDTSTITVDTKQGKRRLVVYSPDTKFRYGHSNKGKESTWDQVKETNYISCSGAYDDKMRLMAKECVHREAK